MSRVSLLYYSGLADSYKSVAIMSSLRLLLFTLGLAFLQLRRASGGVSILTDENYDSQVTGSTDLWLLEFYAPWCGHCKRLRPILDELAQNPSTKFPMRVGVMDATSEKVIPGKFGVKSYPTIKYYKDGVYGKYEGPRTIEGFLKFSERMHGPVFTELQLETRDAQLEQLYSSSQVVFLLTYPRGTSVPALFKTFAKQYQAQATFSAVEEGTEISFSKLEKGKHSKRMLIDGINWSSPDAHISKLEEFLLRNNHPLISSLDSHNFKQLGNLKRLMVIAVVDYKDSGASKKLMSELDRTATELTLEHAEHFVFGHLDGVQWKIFVKQYEASVPALLLLDLAKEQYHTTLVGKDFTASSISSILTNYIQGSVTMKAVPSKGFFEDIKKKFSDFYPYSLLALVPIFLLIASFLVYYPEDSKTKKE